MNDRPASTRATRARRSMGERSQQDPAAIVVEQAAQQALYANYRQDRELPASAAFLDSRSRLFLHRRFSALLAAVQRGRVLELGCGDGTFLMFLRQQGFTEVFGVDLSDSQIRAAQQRGVMQARRSDNLASL